GLAPIRRRAGRLGRIDASPCALEVEHAVLRAHAPEETHGLAQLEAAPAGQEASEIDAAAQLHAVDREQVDARLVAVLLAGATALQHREIARSARRAFIALR